MTAGDQTVHVVCSLFRPTHHLDRQLESILEQTHSDLRVWLRADDAESDTAATIEAWHRRDQRVAPMPGATEPVGTCASYGRLVRTALDHEATWIALADQDDEWLPSHLADSLALAARAHDPTSPSLALADRAHAPTSPSLALADHANAPAPPTLVHGDLELVDEAGALLAPSFFAHQRIHHESRHALGVLAVQNFVTGCATVLNRPLAELAWPFPAEAIMHDWWIALCAAGAGHILARDRATVRYRQHDRNQIGAKPYAEVVRELGQRTLRWQRHSNEPLLETVRQCRALRLRLAERAVERRGAVGADEPSRADTPDRIARATDLLDRYLALYRPGVSRLRRALGLYRLGIGRQDALLDLSLKAKLLTTPLVVEPTAPTEPLGH